MPAATRLPKTTAALLRFTAPAGFELIAIGCNAWGRGRTTRLALKAAREHLSRDVARRARLEIWLVPLGCRVDGLGRICTPSAAAADPEPLGLVPGAPGA